MAEPSREIVDELPGDATGAGTARDRPLQRLALQCIGARLEPVVRRISLHHVEVLVLGGVVKAEPQAEAVGQGHLLLDGLRRVDGGRALVLHHVARHQVAAVRRGVEHHVLRAALDAAFQHRLQRLVGGVVPVERQVVAEHDEAVAGGAQVRQALGQRIDVLAVNLDELEIGLGLARTELQRRAHFGVRRLHQRRLAHAARSPQQGVVGRQALGEAARVVEELLDRAVDALEESQRLTVNLGDRQERLRVRLPYEGFRSREIEPQRGLGSEPFQGRRQAVQRAQNGFVVGHRGLGVLED